VGAVGADVHPLHQQPDDARLLGREQLVPQRVKPMQRFARLRLDQVGRLGPRGELAWKIHESWRKPLSD
jgi:hypothetical protein